MRAVDVARIGLGATLLLRPQLATRLTATPATGGALGLARLLGGRYLAHGLVVGLADSSGLRRAGTGVEVLHAVSMGPLAALDPDHRRLAAAGAGIALGLAAWERLG